MRRSIPVSTDDYLRLVALVGLVCAGCVVGVEAPPIPVVVALLLGLGVAVSLALDVWGGLVVGLGAAAGLAALRQDIGRWSAADFKLAVAEVALIVVACMWAGLTAQGLRTTILAAGRAEIAPPYPSLGLLDADAVDARLAEEVMARARDNTPVGLALLDVRPLAAHLPPDVDVAVHEAAARQVASRTGQLDVPFALSADRLGVIFPHAVGGLVWDTVGRVLEGIRSATITVGPERRLVALSDLVAVEVGISEQQASTVSVAGLFEAARAALEVAEGDQP